MIDNHMSTAVAKHIGERSDSCLLGVKHCHSKRMTTVFYHYILSTPEQREAIDLTKHKAKLQEIITGFFSKRLISLEIQKDGYILTLKDSFPVGDKRMLGRLISTNSGLKQYVRTVSYNNKQDSSGQLFKFKKPDSTKTAEKTTV